MTEATTNALLIIEGTSVHGSEALRQVVADVMELITCECGGTAEIVAWP